MYVDNIAFSSAKAISLIDENVDTMRFVAISSESSITSSSQPLSEIEFITFDKKTNQFVNEVRSQTVEGIVDQCCFVHSQSFYISLLKSNESYEIYKCGIENFKINIEMINSCSNRPILHYINNILFIYKAKQLFFVNEDKTFQSIHVFDSGILNFFTCNSKLCIFSKDLFLYVFENIEDAFQLRDIQNLFNNGIFENDILSLFVNDDKQQIICCNDMFSVYSYQNLDFDNVEIGFEKIQSFDFDDVFQRIFYKNKHIIKQNLYNIEIFDENFSKIKILTTDTLVIDCGITNEYFFYLDNVRHIKIQKL
eukprot:TRINITY_DN2147_c0_g1_i1.p1 TRINITY_DN2147_c0_g1~~TRINITY_DN2147_c0_g1_i1.p1  ORF type:complete len:309 (-),score=79.72 TRINITY_DN2147_c0_g1_i1:270-1196(-)